MSDIASLRRMQKITAAACDRERQSFSRVLAEEATLRAELARIETLDQQARAATDVPHRAIGADVIWQGWVGRTKSALNLRLAAVLARKAQHRDRVRRAHGKVLAVDALLQRALTERKKRLSKQALDRIIDHSLLQ